jgi:benzoate/toluate 1,2-dioxygenase beta subunit
MDIDNDLKRDVAKLINWETTLLDRREWDDWIDLFAEDAVYWVPTWVDEERTVTDPETQLNLMYFRNRGGIEDRVFRIESRDSYASLPLDRTVHIVSNILVAGVEGDEISATANCLVHSFGKHGAQTRASLYDFKLRKTEAGLKIILKKITLIDDKLEGPVDIYHL